MTAHKDLLQEIVQCECKLAAPPSNPPPRDWACPLGSGALEEDDQEVTFPGGGGVPARTTAAQAPHPAPAGTDMGQLITALTMGLQISTPKNKHFQWQCGTWQNQGVL